MTTTNTTDTNWTDDNGNHQGGQSCGFGYTIAWQRGPVKEPSDRNGAFLIEVLGSCLSQLQYFQNSKFACPENEEAVEKIEGAIEVLESRRKQRAEAGKLGTNTI